MTGLEQAHLEHLGDPVLVGVQLGILEGQGESRGELLDEVQLRLAECGLAAATAEAERTDHPIPRPEWHMHHLRARLSRRDARSPLERRGAHDRPLPDGQGREQPGLTLGDDRAWTRAHETPEENRVIHEPSAGTASTASSHASA